MLLFLVARSGLSFAAPHAIFRLFARFLLDFYVPAIVFSDSSTSPLGAHGFLRCTSSSCQERNALSEELAEKDPTCGKTGPDSGHQGFVDGVSQFWCRLLRLPRVYRRSSGVDLSRLLIIYYVFLQPECHLCEIFRGTKSNNDLHKGYYLRIGLLVRIPTVFDSYIGRG